MSLKGASYNIIYAAMMLPGLTLVAIALMLSMMFLRNYERKLYR